jgi:sodium/potassium/calcium exchanger 6
VIVFYNYWQWIPYLENYFCATSTPFALLHLFSDLIILVSLFIFLGTAAGDYFCPNLNTVAKMFGMGEHLMGVTFLAFGNGAPDLFATFGAIQNNASGLAMGSLLGAGCFISTCVVGSVGLVTGFQVAPG